MDVWNIEETRNHIVRLFGVDQLEMAKPSLRSVADRMRFVEYHFFEFQSILRRYLEDLDSDPSILEFMLGAVEMENASIDQFLTMVGANVLACVQSMHSIGDIFAHVIYYSLAINSSNDHMSEAGINIKTVEAILQKDCKTVSLSRLMGSFNTGAEASHIAALSNHGKHRSIVRQALCVEVGEPKKSHTSYALTPSNTRV